MYAVRYLWRMLSSRITLVIWITGTLLLFGLWGSSMFYSYGLSHTGVGQHGSVRILSAYSGSIHLSQYTAGLDPFSPSSGIGWFADEYESGAIDDPFATTVTFKHPPEPFGRYYFRVDAHNDSLNFSCPIWVLMLLFALLFFPTYLLRRRRLLRVTGDREHSSTSI